MYLRCELVVFLSIYTVCSVCRVEFYDELSKVESSVDVGGAGGSGGEGEGERGSDEPPQMADFSVKALKLSGLLVELGNEQVQEVKLDQSLNGIKLITMTTYTTFTCTCTRLHMYMFLIVHMYIHQLYTINMYLYMYTYWIKY